MGWDFLNTLLLLDISNKQRAAEKDRRRQIVLDELTKVEAIYQRATALRDDMEARQDEFATEEYDRLVDEVEDTLDDLVARIVELKQQLRQLN